MAPPTLRESGLLISHRPQLLDSIAGRILEYSGLASTEIPPQHLDVNSQRRVNLLSIACVILLFTFACAAQRMGHDPAEVIKWHRDLATRFMAGDTNVPMLLITDCCTTTFRVERSGKTLAAHTFISNWMRPGELSVTNRQLLLEVLNSLPPPPNEPPPQNQQLLVSGLRSNQWFHAVYCRTNLPSGLRTFLGTVGHASLF